MAIERENAEEAQTRLEWMIREFQDARRRRLVKAGGRAVDTHTDTGTDTDSNTAVATPFPSR